MGWSGTMGTYAELQERAGEWRDSSLRRTLSFLAFLQFVEFRDARKACRSRVQPWKHSASVLAKAFQTSLNSLQRISPILGERVTFSCVGEPFSSSYFFASQK